MSGISRRTFNSLAPLAFAAGARAASVAPSDKVRIGMIGCGGISVADSNAFLSHPECEIVAICDIDDAMISKTLERLDKLHGMKPDTAKDYRRVVERKDIDVVLVCTPDHWHALPAIAAMHAGKDVYVEKPLATSVLESRAVRDAARQTKRVVQMGTHWRSGPHYAEAVEMVQSGKLGKVRQVRCFAYLDWVTDCGNPPNGPIPAGVDYDMWLWASSVASLQQESLPFQLPLVLGLRRRADDRLGRAPDQYRAMGHGT